MGEDRSKSRPITVDYLRELLNDLSSIGHGDMVIGTIDGDYIHKDEIIVDYSGNKLMFRGNIFNTNLFDNVMELNMDIKSAINKFYARL